MTTSGTNLAGGGIPSENNERILALAELIKDNWTLCDFMGKAEKEYMVATTIHACRINLKEHGEAFSFKGGSLNTETRMGQNVTCYGQLKADGYLKEVERQGVTVIIPTDKLLTALEDYLARKNK